MDNYVVIDITTLKEVKVDEEKCYCCYLEDGWHGKCNACQQKDKRKKEKKEIELVDELKELQDKFHQTRDSKYFYQNDHWKGRIVSKLLRRLWIM
jgi:hypothetical protein